MPFVATHASAGTDYRADIDSLRALAVAGVILFHADFDAVGGGFAGVDVFFAISGFLITAIIVREHRRGDFDLARFYERRVRRIVPALLAMLLPTTLAALWLLDPASLADYAESLLAVLLFGSNFYFITQAGYFAPAVDEVPLLHTWSLGVEEQFYIVFPFALGLLWRFGPRRVAAVLVAVALLSLAGAELGRKLITQANFYLPFTRAWELLAGSLLALAMARDGRRPHEHLPRAANEALAAAGVAMIVACFVGYSGRTTQFPSVWAVPAVLGVLLVIAFGPGAPLTTRALSWRPLVLLGLISYSAYLWHQPVFAFARVLVPHAPSQVTMAGLIALTLALAWLSWYFIELPFRGRRALPRRQTFAMLGSGSLALLAGGAAVLLSGGWPQRYAPERIALSATMTPRPQRMQCMSRGDRLLGPRDACRGAYPDNVAWATLGDSHVLEPAYALAQKLAARREGVLELNLPGCPPALNFDALQLECRDWINRTVEYLAGDARIHHVLLAFRHGEYLHGHHNRAYPRVPDEPPHMRTTLDPDAAREAYWASYEALIERLLAAGKRVYVLYPVPELPKHVRHYVFGTDPERPVTPLAYYQRRNEFMLRKLATLPWSDRLIAVDPVAALCVPAGCRAVVGGAAMYFDDDHLSVAGARRVLDVAGVAAGNGATRLPAKP